MELGWTNVLTLVLLFVKEVLWLLIDNNCNNALGGLFKPTVVRLMAFCLVAALLYLLHRFRCFYIRGCNLKDFRFPESYERHVHDVLDWMGSRGVGRFVLNSCRFCLNSPQPCYSLDFTSVSPALSLTPPHHLPLTSVSCHFMTVSCTPNRVWECVLERTHWFNTLFA